MDGQARALGYFALFTEIGLVLFTITLIVNVISRLLIWRMTATRTRRAPVRPAAEAA